MDISSVIDGVPIKEVAIIGLEVVAVVEFLKQIQKKNYWGAIYILAAGAAGAIIGASMGYRWQDGLAIGLAFSGAFTLFKLPGTVNKLTVNTDDTVTTPPPTQPPVTPQPSPAPMRTVKVGDIVLPRPVK